MNQEVDIEDLAPWLMLVITLIGGFLRVLQLGIKGMWLDETFSLWMASNTIPDMLQWLVKIDQHPPLYYFLLHYWIAFVGDTPYYVRLLSVLFGVGTIPVIYLIGKRLSGDLMGLAAAMLLAVSPFNIYFAQETRMYTLLTFNAALAIYALVRLLTDSRSSRPIGSQIWGALQAWCTGQVESRTKTADENFSYARHYKTGWRAWVYRHRWLTIRVIETDVAWIAFIIFSTATMFSHNTAVLFPLAANIFVLGLMLYQRFRKSETPLSLQVPSFWNWVKAQIAILALWSPWIPSFIKQASTVNERFWIPEPTWESVIQVFKTFLNPPATIPDSLSVVIWSFYVLVLCLGLVYYRKKLSQFLFLATLFAVPVLVELLVSIQRPIFYGRTLIWTTIPLFLVLAAGIAQFRLRFMIFLTLGSLAAINVFAIGDYYRWFQKEDWASAAGYVALFAEKDDLVLFNSNFVEIPFNYYFEGYEKGYSIEIEKLGFPLDLFDRGVLEPEMTPADVPALTSLLQEHDRVWLVYSHDSYTDPLGLLPQTLASQKKLLRTREFYGGQVQLYVSP